VPILIFDQSPADDAIIDPNRQATRKAAARTGWSSRFNPHSPDEAVICCAFVAIQIK